MNDIKTIMIRFIFIFLFLWNLTFAMQVGNLSDPCIQKKGIFFGSSRFSFRLGYLGDYIYDQTLRDEFILPDCHEKASHGKLWTQAATATFNLLNRIDLYTILGATRIQIDQDLSTSQQFAWGVGGKIVFLHYKNFRLGVDLKYFQSKQTPSFFECEHQAYNITSTFSYNYHETQGAFGLSYQTKYVSPYIAATYLIAKLEPQPPVAYVRIPSFNFEVPVTSKSVTIDSRFGCAIGLSLIDHQKANLNLEWRGLSQSAISLSGEIRF